MSVIGIEVKTPHLERPLAKKRIFLASNANAGWESAAADALETAITQADAKSVLTVDYEVPPDIVTRSVQAAASRGIRIVIDPSPGERVDDASIKLCAAIAPNGGEAKALTGIAVVDESSAAEAAKTLAAKGVPLVCITGRRRRHGLRGW